MTIEAKVIADSISEEGVRITTLQLKYPRFIHSELMTHRVFSRNASSSRAIPVKRMIQDIMDDPAMPIHWGKNQPGMQAREEHDEVVIFPDQECHALYCTPQEAWLKARDRAVDMAQRFADAGYHKQIVNRLLEPFQHIHVVVTATEWANFFALRRHEDAQPEIKALADAIYEAMEASQPYILDEGEWHLPYVSGQEVAQHGYEIACKLSVSRCARVSFLKHDGTNPSVEDDLKLYARLIEHSPMHASPAEHQATPDRMDLVYREYLNGDHHHVEEWDQPSLHGNLRGWIQYRKTLPNEAVWK